VSSRDYARDARSSAGACRDHAPGEARTDRFPSVSVFCVCVRVDAEASRATRNASTMRQTEVIEVYAVEMVSTPSLEHLRRREVGNRSSSMLSKRCMEDIFRTRFAGGWSPPVLKSVRQVETHRARLYGMKVYVRYALSRFAWQA